MELKMSLFIAITCCLLLLPLFLPFFIAWIPSQSLIDYDEILTCLSGLFTTIYSTEQASFGTVAFSVKQTRRENIAAQDSLAVKTVESNEASATSKQATTTRLQQHLQLVHLSD